MTTSCEPDCLECGELEFDADHADACWWCGEPAPEGICVRPHPDFSYLAARTLRYITPEGGLVRRADCRSLAS